jgi:hypothetical protein
MAVDPSVRIDIAAEFTGKKAFKQADTSTAQLSKNVKNLAKTFGVAFSVTKVLAYTKASVKAAAEDQKAQQQLALALKNVGLSRDAATAEGYIQRIEKEFGIVDDKLRPAYTKLAIATRDTVETERLISIAMDISANSGKDLESVTSALSRAYLGNNTSLSKLGIGISKADLQTKSFKDITDQLAVTFAGAAKTSADSFAGSMDKLAIASNNAKEIIGTSLIGALQSLGEDDSISTLAGDIEGAATSLANFVDSIVYLKEQVKSIPGAGIFGYLFSGVTDLLGRFSPQRLAELIKQIKGFQGMGNVAMTGGSNMDTQKFEAQQKKLAADKIKSDKKISDAKIKADKLAAINSAKLAKAAAVFDLQKIQIAAALKGKISEEERIRLLLMQAIEDENADKAEELAKKLEQILEKNIKIAEALAAIGMAKDPFTTWAGSLSLALIELGKYGKTMADISSTTFIPGVHYNPSQNADRNYDNKLDAVVGAITNEAAATIIADTGTNNLPVPGATATPANNNPFAFLEGMADLYGFGSMGSTPAPTINITVQGSVLNGDEFSEIVNDALINANKTGMPRTAAGFLID